MLARHLFRDLVQAVRNGFNDPATALTMAVQIQIFFIIFACVVYAIFPIGSGTLAWGFGKFLILMAGLIVDFIFFLFGINIVISIYRATFTQNP